MTPEQLAAMEQAIESLLQEYDMATSSFAKDLRTVIKQAKEENQND